MSTSDGNGNGHNNGKSGKSDKGHDWPTTVDEAVDRLVHELSDKDKETVRTTPKDELIKFHFGWGMGIRNAFGLWAATPR
jgi:uncharacterized protein DUF6794